MAVAAAAPRSSALSAGRGGRSDALAEHLNDTAFELDVEVQGGGAAHIIEDHGRSHTRAGFTQAALETFTLHRKGPGEASSHRGRCFGCQCREESLLIFVIQLGD